jgi:sugar-specific transcriptional regulator TrmB
MDKTNLDINQQFRILRNIGLTESEANIYIANIHLGQASVIELAQRSGYVRQVIYDALPRLIEMGLIKKIKVGKKAKYQTTKVESLEDRVAEISSQIKELVPVLKSRQASFSAIPHVDVYENVIAMREWYRQVLEGSKKGDMMLIWSYGKDWFYLDPKFYEKYLNEKAEKGVRERVIKPDNPENRKRYRQIDKGIAEWRFAKKWWRSDAEIVIWKNEISMLTIRENATNMVVLRSKELAAIEKWNFNMAWDGLNKRRRN